MSDVVERAARRVLARDRWKRERRGLGFGPSAGEVIDDHLPDDAPIWRWAALARAALRRAREIEGRPVTREPHEPREARGGIPTHERRPDGSWRPV